LLHLKYVEKSLVISGDYLAAKDVRRRIEEQERREVEAQQPIGRRFSYELRNWKNVVSQKDSGMPKSVASKKSGTVAYGTSFIHVARDNNFDIQVQPPNLKSPTRRRRMEINGATARKKIPFQPPRAYQLKNEAVVKQAAPFFETQVGEGKFMDSNASPKSQPSESQKEQQISRSPAAEEEEQGIWEDLSTD
jgi:hypothetical protein